jgi:methionyl-tRNA synthetase
MRHFISAGWPYLYDIPGLHNCVPMLFADVFARFYRYRGDEVFFLSGADEHGARTEYVAEGYGTTPRQLLDEKHQATLPLLEKLGLSFDAFGRTGDPFHQRFVEDFFTDLIAQKKLHKSKQKIAWCTRCKRHLPDRFLEGNCPFCESKTYGNQCNNKKVCARIVESENIISPQCAVCAGSIEWRNEDHLFFDMNEYKNILIENADAPERDIAEVRHRISTTLKDNPVVCVTRDTGFGIKVSCLEGKSVYSWVDSLLAKVSMLAKVDKKIEANYWRDPNTKKHFFLGMDGTPFYGTLFPSLLMASGRGYDINNWRIMPNEVFIYEGGICSKSTGTGIWLQEALATLPADYWRFYIFYIHALVESGAERDVDFRWDRFCEAINTWLIRGLGGVVDKAKQVPGDNGIDVEQQFNTLMEAGNIGQSFQLLLTSLVEKPNEEKTKRLAPIFNCFLPNAGDSLSKGISPFPGAPLYSRAIQMEYQDRVDERRAKRGLSEELTDARADVLCVCPINLGEQ